MKFHCDRCKTKYSISDDRVRGKILKIRCKNCSAVITVRESSGVDAGQAVSAAAGVSRPVGTSSGRVATAHGQEVLAGAFKAAVTETGSGMTGSGATPAPVSLDAEWYLSKDGQQEGPFALEAARSWVRSKAASDELYVWSEGYDDWLAIEKVSHFRGVRRGAIPTIDDGDEQTMIESDGFGFLEETPKPLFAATMAAVSAGNPDAIGEEMPRAVFPTASGAGAAQRAPLPLPSFAGPAIPAGARAPAIPQAARGPVMPLAARAPVIPMAARAPAMPSNGAVAAAGKDAGASLEFDIGEASRVVDLHTLMAQRGNAQPLTPGGNVLPGMDSSLGRGSGLAPALSNTGPMGAFAGSDFAQPLLPEPAKKRRGVALPLVGAGVVMAAAAGLLIYLMSGDEIERSVARGSVGGSGNLGYSFSDNGKRSQPTTNGEIPANVEPEAGTDKSGKGKRPAIGPKITPNNTVVKSNPVRDPNEVDLSGSVDKGPTGPLDGDDLMQVYRKNNIAIKMCYERSLKRNPLLKVPKTWVDIQVGLDGRVSSVKIPTMAGTELGTCILARIDRWKFRPTTEVFSSRFPLVFDR